MKKNNWVLFMVVLVIAISTSSCCYVKCSKAALSESKFSNGKGAYKTGFYRNLFLENGHSEQEVHARVEATYQQLFHGDTANQALFFPAGKNGNGPLAYVFALDQNDVRTEGMSYGMMIAVQMNQKADFDALWNWAMTYMYNNIPSHPSEGYFAWSLKRDGTLNSETPATDGEEYFATALYFASTRWGDSAGIYNYKQWADKIVSTMRHHPLRYGATKFSGNKVLYSMVNEELKLVRFGPEYNDFDYTDPSYMVPAFYDVWAKCGPEVDRNFWAQVADSSRAFFRKVTHPITGLAPNYTNFDGTPRRGNQSSWEGIRTQANWGCDWNWWQKDAQQPSISNRILSFYASKGMNTYGVSYKLDGELVNPLHAKVIVSTNAVASLAANKKLAKDFSEELWNTPIPSAPKERYYDALWYCMAMLHCSGQFRLWMPITTKI